MYGTQCVRLEGCKFKIQKSFENGPSPKWIPTLFNPIEPSTCCVFVFDVAFFQVIVMNEIIE